MEDDAITSPGTAPAGSPSDHPARIGPYRIVRVLGEGGMGVVYLAEQSAPIFRRVALKVLKLGLDTKQFVARFEAERQALAVMDHPGIARVHDAGASETGRPYFVMELVHGEPITVYCDVNRQSPRERAQLMIRVCQAVQHAHQKGVIHRDLKPSNVLVGVQDGEAVPKIIDFGVAKAIDRPLTTHTLFTEIGQRIGTPAYMSPEQMEMSGLDVDTRSDVYSLGVMLYELLSGTLPFSEDLLRRAVTSPGLLRDTDPQTPSARVTGLGEKVSSVASRRSSDPASLRRTLEGDLDWITLKAMAMDRARRYETANAFAMDLQRYLGYEPVTARPPSTHDRVAKFVRRHRAGVAMGAAAALLVIGATIMLGVQAQRLARERDRAEREAARASSVTSFLRETLSSADPWSGGRRDVSVAEALGAAVAKLDQSFLNQPLTAAAVRQTIAATYGGLGRFDEAEALARSALETQRKTLGETHEDVAQTLAVLAELYVKKGQYEPADALAREALAVNRRLTSRDNERVAASLTQLADVLEHRGRYADAHIAAEEGLAIRRRVHGARDARVADSLKTLANIVANGFADYTRVDQLLREALEIRRSVYGRDDANVAVTLNDLAVNRVRVEDFAQAEALYNEAVAINRRVLGDDHPEVALTLENLGGVYYRTQRYDECLELLDEVLAMRRKALGNEHTAVGRTLANMGAVRNGAKDYAGAIPPLREAETRLRATLGAEHPDLVTLLSHLGDALTGSGDRDEAETTFRRAVALGMKTLPPDHPDTARVRIRLGNLLVATGRFGEAEPLLIAAVDAREMNMGRDHAATRAASADVAKLYAAWGRADKAAEWQQRASRD